MKNIIFLEELIQTFCEKYNESFFNFSILSTEINFYSSDKEKGKTFQRHSYDFGINLPCHTRCGCRKDVFKVHPGARRQFPAICDMYSFLVLEHDFVAVEIRAAHPLFCAEKEFVRFYDFRNFFGRFVVGVENGYFPVALSLEKFRFQVFVIIKGFVSVADFAQKLVLMMPSL